MSSTAVIFYLCLNWLRSSPVWKKFYRRSQH